MHQPEIAIIIPACDKAEDIGAFLDELAATAMAAKWL